MKFVMSFPDPSIEGVEYTPIIRPNDVSALVHRDDYCRKLFRAAVQHHRVRFDVGSGQEDLMPPDKLYKRLGEVFPSLRYEVRK